MLFIAALLSSCGSSSSAIPTEAVYTPKYATTFSIVRNSETKELLLRISNPWQGAKDILFHHKIEKPAQRIVALSSSYVAMLDAIGCTKNIVGVSGARFISTPALQQAYKEGFVAEVGYDSAFDFERIKSIGTDLVLLYGVAGEAKMISDKLRELAIPYVYIGDYIEREPLGKAEWVVALGYLCGKETEAIQLFSDIEKRYTAIRDRAHTSAYRPRVMLNTPYRDSWFMPPHNSYVVRLIEDAGGDYILPKDKNRESTTSAPISMEEALLLATRADFWLNVGQYSSLAELIRAVPHFANIDAVRHHRVYNNTLRATQSGGSDYWESGAIRPDIILEDLVKILHHEYPTDSLYFYKRLE